jgi:hypothetical protein
MHPRLAETMTFVEEKRRELLQSIEGVEGDLLSRKADPEAWSVAEILEHLRIVESGIARLITKRAGQAREAGLSEEKATSSVMPTFEPMQAALDRGKMQAPVSVRPGADVDISAVLEGLNSSREALRAAVVSASGLALGEIKHTHPVLGEIDLYQWLIFVGQHEGRHKKQIERTLQSIPI